MYPRLVSLALAMSLAAALVGCDTGTEGDVPKSIVARATASPDSGYTPLDVTFSAATSTHAKDLPLRYLWVFPDGSSSVQITVQKPFPQEGRYRARLTVSDAGGAKDTTSVEVIARKVPPIACPALDIPPDGMYYASICGSQEIFSSQAQMRMESTGFSGRDLAFSFYFKDPSGKIIYSISALFEQGSNFSPGVYRIAPYYSAGKIFAPYGNFGDRLAPLSEGTIVLDSISHSFTKGSFNLSYKDINGVPRIFVARFSAKP